MNDQSEEDSLVAEVSVTHAFFVTAMTKTFEPNEKLRYSGYCALTAYRLGKDDDIEETDPHAHLLLRENDSHVRTKTEPFL